MKLSIIFACASLLLIGGNLKAQKNLSLYNMRGIPQAVSVNPAFIPKAKIYISLPMGQTSFGISNSGFSFNDIFTRRADDSLVVNSQQVVDGLKKRNIFNIESSFELFGFGLKVRDFYLNFSVSNKFQTNFIYPKDLIKFALEGNGKSFIGKRASLDGLGINLNLYNEYAFGFAKEFGEKLSIGGRLKLLSGVTNFTTKKTELGIYTDPTTFALTVDGSAEINSSNIIPDSTSLSNGSFSAAEIGKSFYNFANFGIGLDLGATYKLNDKISFSASLVDLGYIRWSNNVSSYKTNDFNYTFEGIDLKQYFSANDSSSTTLDAFADSLSAAFNVTKNTDSYTTSLYTKFYMGANYQLNSNINFGAVLLSEFIKGKYNPSLSLSTNFSLKSWLNATVHYAIYNKTFTNIGFGLSMRGGPMQWFIMTDNIFSFINPLNTRSVNISTGLSIAIVGKDKKKKDEKINSQL
jgi:hypothetical protein